MTVTVSDVRLTHEGDDAVLRAAVRGSTADTLWFRIPDEFADLVTDRADPFAVALVLPAMRHGQDLHLDAAVTDELLFRLNQDVQHWVRSIMPMYSLIRVTAAQEVSAAPPGDGIATGFSAGIDSFSLIDDYLLSSVPDRVRVTHLLYNHVVDDSETTRAAFEIGYRNAKARADAWGTPIVAVRTNIDDHFTGTNTAVANTVTVRNAAVAHALSHGIGLWYHASSVSFDNARGGPSPFMEVSDVISLPLLSTSGITLRAVGSERSRVRKTLQVIEVPDAAAALNVCMDVRPGRGTINCSRCEKCVRTLTTLEIAGRLDAVDPRAFDLDTYVEHRDHQLALLLLGRASVDREVIAFARERGWRFPSEAVRRARRMRTVLRARASARAVKRALIRPRG